MAEFRHFALVAAKGADLTPPTRSEFHQQLVPRFGNYIRDKA
jgi:hypothetical protein